jgi:hypothetical protein
MERFGVVLERRHPRPGVARATVEVLIAESVAIEARTSARKLVNWEKTGALYPSSTTSASRGRRTSSFALRRCTSRAAAQGQRSTSASEAGACIV